MFELRISKRAEKQIKKLKKEYQAEVIEMLADIKENPLLGKSLARDLNDRFSYRIRVYRIIYKINQADKVIDVLSAGHRSRAYN
ncbi:type II toxin-antitoxin system RelE/ParE family toxin [Candidatus Daviesbacteria bacterium]|nr:type II toxin-antitoxin system RelE/ParE family toxin [Candidatus Daviesbacteria bacterium]